MVVSRVADHSPVLVARPACARVRAAVLYGAALGLFFAAYANWRHPVLRLASPAANSLCFLAATALPWAALVAGRRVLRGWRLAAHGTALMPLLLGTLPLAFCASTDAIDVAQRGADLSFEPVRTLRLGASRVRAYRTNCGAVCDFGVVVRQERPLVPGLLLVRTLGGWYHAYDAALAAEAGGVRVTIVATVAATPPPAGPHRVAVRSWVYF